MTPDQILEKGLVWVLHRKMAPKAVDDPHYQCINLRIIGLAEQIIHEQREAGIQFFVVNIADNIECLPRVGKSELAAYNLLMPEFSLRERGQFNSQIHKRTSIEEDQNILM